MKAILLSIRPEWCDLIIRGQKTIEVRKTRPKLETPFRVYIYCTGSDDWYMKLPKSGMKKMSSKVIGEFTCDRVERLTHIDKPSRLSIVTSDLYYKPTDELLQAACLTEAETEKYLRGGDGYGWHISELKIYDKPREVRAFTGLQSTRFGMRPVEITSPPQSWRYVEEFSNE